MLPLKSLFTGLWDLKEAQKSLGRLSAPSGQLRDMRLRYCSTRGTKHRGEPLCRRNGCSSRSLALARSLGSLVSMQFRKSFNTGEICEGRGNPWFQCSKSSKNDLSFCLYTLKPMAGFVRHLLCVLDSWCRLISQSLHSCHWCVTEVGRLSVHHLHHHDAQGPHVHLTGIAYMVYLHTLANATIHNILESCLMQISCKRVSAGYGRHMIFSLLSNITTRVENFCLR